MISRISNIIFLISLSSLLVAQIPQVPSKMEFAGIKLNIHESARKEIQKDVDMLRASDKYFRIKLDRALLYFPLIEQAFDDMGVPSDFKYLSVQESALISDVVSVSKAVGFWQFKDFTGREVGLRIDNRIDERKNIVAASKGAATYMKRNNFLYDNWIYALTAYYAGPGGAAKFVDKSNFGVSKMDIDKKTHWYVKRFLAHKIAFENELNNTHSEGMKLVPYTKGEGKDINKIAKEFNIEPDFLQHYNKWIKNGKIPDDKTYAVIIPVYDAKAENVIASSNETQKEKSPSQKIETPAKNEAKPRSYAKELKEGIMSGNSINVKINGSRAVLAGRNDNINTLSAQGGISVDQFIKYNDLSQKKLITGEVYYLESKSNRSDIGFHVVEPGETMWTISQRYGIKLNSLYRKNRMDEGQKVKTGRLLWMDSRRPRKVAVEYYNIRKDEPLVKKEPMRTQSRLPKTPLMEDKTETEEQQNQTNTEKTTGPTYYSSSELDLEGKKHKIAAGETLWSIASQYEVTVEELREWNQLTKYDQLHINQELFVEKPRTKQISENDNRQKVTYVVKPGDTMYRIATRYEMEVTELMNLNGKKDTSISIGEELTVYRSR